VTVLDLLWLVPALPLAGFLLLLTAGGRMPPLPTAVIATGSVGLAALLTLAVGMALLAQGAAGAEHGQILWRWIDVAGFDAPLGLRIDGLALVMTGVITGVGLLIHLYATGYMRGDPDQARFFAYMNLFVFAMLVLVLADNLVLLYLGWEGVGLCSYLLIGFHHDDPANGYAARKAFVVTRVGDTALAIGLFLLHRELGTLDIELLLARAPEHFAAGDPLCTTAALLILGGAVGKSAQVPLHTWLPDAMAGPTPVSALIHAATMVTAGVYLIARLGELFLLAPMALTAVAVVGLLSLLIAACSALTQMDIKRILAYSTMSQIGYMFLALGVGAFSAAIFHLMTHAFFKALLFLSAGSVILALHHEQDVSRMGGLWRRLPLPVAGLVIGAAALAALPLTSGFYSKDPILLAAWDAGPAGPLLWGGAAFTALLTALYGTRLVCLVCLGPPRGDPVDRSGWAMKVPLVALALLALFGGAIPLLPLAAALPDDGVDGGHGSPVALVTLLIPVVGVLLGGWIWRHGNGRTDPGASDTALARFWRAGWGFDAAWRVLLERPLAALAAGLRREPVDLPFRGIVAGARWLHGRLSASQTGVLRFYALNLGLGTTLVVLTVLVLW
jgi:NADH-quinone oxidoreductase subunit L